MNTPAFRLEFRAFTSTLAGDIEDALRRIDSPSGPRNLVRAVFAAIEGLVSYLKEDALDQARNNLKVFRRAELAVLREETYTLSSRGKAEKRSSFLPFEGNLKFTVRMFTRDCNSDYKPSTP